MSVDIPNYRVLEKLGVGAQSSIYRARCMTTGRDYAVKVVKIAKPEDFTVVELLKAEYAIASSINHPNIRKVFELRFLRQRLRVRGAILFMEYVAGRSMSDRDFRCSLDDMLHYFAEAAKGLHGMHLAGYVHADLKPNNIMITAEGQVKLIDLGQSAKMRQTKTRVQGTIDYMAPEQVDNAVLDQRTDVFGLGATLHKMLTGKAIATGMNRTLTVYSQSLVGKRISDMPEAATQDLPVVISRLIEDCCRLNPAERIPDMPTLSDRLEFVRTILKKRANEAEAGGAVAADRDMDHAGADPTGTRDDWEDLGDADDDRLGSIHEELGLTDDPDQAMDADSSGAR